MSGRHPEAGALETVDRRQHPLYEQSGQYGPCSCFYPPAPLPKLLPVWCYHGPGHTLCCSYPTLTAQAICPTQLTLLGPLLAKRTDCCHSCAPVSQAHLPTPVGISQTTPNCFCISSWEHSVVGVPYSMPVSFSDPHQAQVAQVIKACSAPSPQRSYT